MDQYFTFDIALFELKNKSQTTLVRGKNKHDKSRNMYNVGDLGNKTSSQKYAHLQMRLGEQQVSVAF